jgi:hypothetical protein
MTKVMAVPGRDGIHPLTQVVLSVFRILQLGFKSPETVFIVV